MVIVSVATPEFGPRRVAITGMGAISALGHTAIETWAAMREGRSGIGPIADIPTDLLNVKIAAEVRGYDPPGTSNPNACCCSTASRNSRSIAAREAVAQSGLDFRNDELGERTACIIGTGIGGENYAQRTIAALLRRKQSARASADDRARDGKRAGLPHQHRVRPARARRSPSSARARRPIMRWPGVRHGAQWKSRFCRHRRHRSLHHRADREGLGSRACDRRRHLPPVLQAATRHGARRRRRHLRARGIRTRAPTRRDDPRRIRRQRHVRRRDRHGAAVRSQRCARDSSRHSTTPGSRRRH